MTYSNPAAYKSAMGRNQQQKKHTLNLLRPACPSTSPELNSSRNRQFCPGGSAYETAPALRRSHMAWVDCGLREKIDAVRVADTGSRHACTGRIHSNRVRRGEGCSCGLW